jgi:multimeric flavodoxin WrbA
MDGTQDPPLVLGLHGSPREHSNSAALMEAVLEGAAQAGAATRGLGLAALGVQPCVGCERCRGKGRCQRILDGMQQIYPLIQEARGLVLITPVHNYNVSAVVKAFIDRLYCFYDFTPPRPGPWSSRLAGQGRRAVSGAVGEQEEGEGLGVVLPAMRLPLEALGYGLEAELVVEGVFPPGRVGKDRAVLERGRAAGRELGGALARG